MDIKQLFHQFLKFGLVGAIAFVIDYTGLMILSQLLHMHPIAAATISFALSVCFNYVASMHYVFERRDDLSRKREFVTFVVLSTIGLILNDIIMGIGTGFLGSGALAVTINKIVATCIVFIWNFWSRKHFLEAK